MVVTAVEFDYTELQVAEVSISDIQQSFQAGQRLAAALAREDLVHVFVLSEALGVNGTDLVKGMTKYLPRGVGVTGGLAGDDGRFKQTLAISQKPLENGVVAVGFYGKQLKVGYGSLGGWDMFGPDRRITRSKGNVLYELDGKSALELYKRYLGEHAKGLPATALLFPLSVRNSPDQPDVVRTVLSVDEEEQSMTFAGDMPVGAYARLMKANFDRLIDGAVDAAKRSYCALGGRTPELAILVSCVGRKMILKQRVEEEVEGVRDVIGNEAVMTGFYSYGEISPLAPNANCELHNQTMTITTFYEEQT
jgi:hypothetical protein